MTLFETALLIVMISVFIIGAIASFRALHEVRRIRQS